MRKKTSTAPKRRLPPHVRREALLEEAILLFSEKGLAASTRELAERCGVAQPLLYQHFPTKQHLVDAVFDAVFERMSARDWLSALRDRQRPLRERLIEFFQSYANTLYDPKWIRIYMFAGLDGGEFNRAYIRRYTEPLLRTVAVEIRQDAGAKSAPRDVTKEELELLWILHGGIYYSAIRKQIYGIAITNARLLAVIEASVDGLLESMAKLLR